MDNYNTILGWAVCVAAGGACWYYYVQPDANRRAWRGRNQRGQISRSATTSLGPSEVKSRRREERRLAGQAAARAKGASSPQTTPTPAAFSNDDTTEREDLNWAKELDKRKTGTSLAGPSRSAVQRQRTVKQSGVNNTAADLSAPSSVGGDADDDLSPTVSPKLNGVHNGAHANNVTDMLEPATPGPSVLNITASNKVPRPERPKHQSHQSTQEETKKQRQNRKKVEEKKAQRDADEAERRALEERQRRTAREARGEPAKNGLGIAPAPTSNAWKSSNAVATAPAAPATNGQLLDTFVNDSTTESTTYTSGQSSPVQGKDNWWKAEMPSEEEQIQRIQEQDETSWNTVANKKSKRKNTANGGAVQPIDA